MRYTNYDIIETDSGDIFLYLSGSYYKLTGDPKAESFARKIIHKDFGSHKKTGDLRVWVCEATPKKETVDIESLKMMSDVFDAHDIGMSKVHWGEAYADAIKATTYTDGTYTDEDGDTIRTPRVKPLPEFFDGS